MKDHNQHEIQMSEAFLNSAFLALSGGFQDAYTYNARNEVFCNAQTGNVVLMSQHFMAGELTAGLGYFFPIIFFALGVWVAEKIQANYKYAQKLQLAAGCSVGRNPDLIYSRFPANRIQYAGKCHGIFRLCNAGTVLPQGKWIFLCKYYVYR